jgi:predicted Zn-dependent peptidase
MLESNTAARAKTLRRGRRRLMTIAARLRFTALGLSLLAATAAAAPPPSQPLIPFEKFTLDNGLAVIVHTDRKAPVVAVNIWYHVGSKNEKPGKTGFAHLFEHLMFQGSENYNDEYFKPFEQAGATNQNGTTSFDRTNYFQNVPTTALDMALWMESDRMGHLLGVIDQARLDEQRGVVQNEKRLGVCSRPSYARATRPPTPIGGCRSGRWRTSTPPRWTT